MNRRQAFAALCFMMAVPGYAESPVASAAKAPAVVRVRLNTTLGAIVLELEKDRAPITASNFLRYVDQKRFDGITFYRTVKVADEDNPDAGFIQGGTTDLKRVLPPIKHEPTTKTGLSHVKWAVSLARWAPGTGQADFTILLSDAKSMDADPKAPGDNLGYAVFGKVVDGFDVVENIHNGPVSSTKGAGIMRGQMLEQPVKILTTRRVAQAPVTPGTRQ